MRNIHYHNIEFYNPKCATSIYGQNHTTNHANSYTLATYHCGIIANPYIALDRIVLVYTSHQIISLSHTCVAKTVLLRMDNSSGLLINIYVFYD